MANIYFIPLEDLRLSAKKKRLFHSERGIGYLCTHDLSFRMKAIHSAGFGTVPLFYKEVAGRHRACSLGRS